MRYIIIISIVFLTLVFGCQQKSVEGIQNEIDRISTSWTPDKRVAICNLKLIKGEGGELILKGESMFPGAKKEVFQLFTSRGINATDSVTILPDTLHLQKSWGLVSLSVANLRSKPAHSSELVSQAIMGTPVRLLKESEDWLLIQTPDRYIAWTNKSAVQQLSQQAMVDWRNASRMIYTSTSGTIYQDDQQSEVQSDLVAGAIVVRLSEKLNLAKVGLPDGRVGYVNRMDWLDFKQWKDTVTLAGNRMITTGKKFLGFPYLWGGTSSKGLDCSGFVKTVCFLNGVILERDASQQVKHGVELDPASGWDKLQKGDLLFFGSKQPYRVTHVGMYIGEGEFIHESGFVHINSLDKNSTLFNNDLAAKLLGARRIIGFSPEQGYWLLRQHNWY